MDDLSVRREQAAKLVRRLSPRESEVLHGLVDGLSSKEMACRLGISPRTIDIHRSRLLHKLNVTTSLEAASIGALAGYGECGFLDR